MTRSFFALLSVTAITLMSACADDAPAEGAATDVADVGGDSTMTDAEPGDVTGSEDADATPDPDADATEDADGTPDTSTDAPADADTDAMPDAEPDAAPDSGDDTTPDIAPDTTPDTTPDVTPDVLLPGDCGDGVLNEGEECDDGNDNDLDLCLSTCVRTTCGDGVVNGGFEEETFSSPIIENPFGAAGPVCDDGQSCFDDECFFLDAPDAPEHGMCQALGFERTDSVIWGDGEGEDSEVMPSVFNWVCENFVCQGSENTDSTDNCSAAEMLNTIRCQTGRLETCDDGADNADAPNACRTNCLAPVCGDAIVDDGEECDDGNDVEDDACSTLCAAPVCGDGIRQAEEQCDDGNDDDTDACMPDCSFPLCGDGIVNTSVGLVTIDNPVISIPGSTGGVCGNTEFGLCPTGVDCDVSDAPGASEHGVCQALGFERASSVRYGTTDVEATIDLSTWFCVDFECELNDNFFFVCDAPDIIASITCSTVTVETCDEGEANADVADSCRTSCLSPVCGDGIVDDGEACDDGNLDEEDTCSTICEVPVCGDGIVQGDEECDDADDNSDTEADACRLDCLAAACGDLIVDEGETCDDGNDVNDDACRNDCVVGTCGNGELDAGEQCDDGNDVENDGCRGTCVVQSCGDGIVDEGEECDDGNALDDDLCTTACVFNGVPGTDEFLGEAVGPEVATNVFSELTDDAVTSCGDVGGTDIVYGWVAPATGEYQIDTCGSVADTVLMVLDGSGTGPELTCNDDNLDVCTESLASSVTVSLEAGQSVAIVVDGYNAFATGAFTLNITAL